jgi:hypothetical protein
MTSTAPTRDAVVGGMQLPSGAHRPGDPLGPTSGGSIGSQGMGDPVHYFTSTDVRMTSTALHVAQCVGGL